MSRFNQKDQLAFATLSGDFNPAHLDPNYARRLIWGGASVHGIHQVFFGINYWLKSKNKKYIFQKFNAKFLKPLLVTSKFNIEVTELEKSVDLAKQKGIDVRETERLLYLAKSSLERGNFLEAFERAKEAQLTFAIETGGKYINEIQFAMKKNPEETVSGFVSFGFFVFGASLFTKWRYIKRKLRKLVEEQALLQDLMKATQIDVFQKSKLSMAEYGDAMTQYEKRLSRVLQDTVIYENKRRNLLKFKSKTKKLTEEKDRLRQMLGSIQKDYISGAKYETRVYENMLASYSERLTEVEESLAISDAKKMKKKGLNRIKNNKNSDNKTDKQGLKKDNFKKEKNKL